MKPKTTKVSTEPKKVQLFDTLSWNIQFAVICNIWDYDEEVSSVSEVPENVMSEIYRMTSRELFESWLIWNGIIGYTESILAAHEEIFNHPQEL